jgi:hypothetical protein
MIYGEPWLIECLACREVRVVYGRRADETGSCESCGYVGWTYADDLDSTMRAMIINGGLARPRQAPAEPFPGERRMAAAAQRQDRDMPACRVAQRPRPD